MHLAPGRHGRRWTEFWISQRRPVVDFGHAEFPSDVEWHPIVQAKGCLGLLIRWQFFFLLIFPARAHPPALAVLVAEGHGAQNRYSL